MRPSLRYRVAGRHPATPDFSSGQWALLRREASAATSSTSVEDLLRPSIVPTRHFQRSLPHLPVPSLAQTVPQYIEAIQPLLTPAQLEKLKELIASFCSNEGRLLQAELLRVDAANAHTSYVSSDTFERVLKQRQPLPLFSHNTLLVRQDDEKTDLLVRSSFWIWSSVLFYKRYLDNELEPSVQFDTGSAGDAIWRRDWFQRTAALLPSFLSTTFVTTTSGHRVTPQDMSQFDCLFNTSRVPGVLQDEVQAVGFTPHIAVQYRGHQFIVTVADADCRPIPVSQIYARLREIVASQVAPPLVDIGVLTALSRTEWSAARTVLLRHAGNRANIEAMEESMLVLNLDDRDGDGVADLFGPIGLTSKTPSIRSTNRWWDKSLSVQVNRYGCVSVSAEQSWGDGAAVRRYVDDVCALSYAADVATLEKSAAATEPVRQLQWYIPAELESTAQRARRQLDTEAEHLDVHAGVLRASSFFATANAALSASASVEIEDTLQLACQLARWRLHRRPVSAVQTIPMHRYRRGRTEQVYLYTPACEKFCQAMLGNDSTLQQQTCKEALGRYYEIMRNVAAGGGISSHLFGLYMTSVRQHGRAPELYADEGFRELNRIGLHFSFMESPASFGTGFHLIPGGYTVSCSRTGDAVLYQISSCRKTVECGVSSRDFAMALDEACRDILVLKKSL